MIYTGIGSRETPQDIQLTMTKIASYLGKRGYTLRSGGAEGADLAFEKGCLYNMPKEIFIPWKGFNGSKATFLEITKPALEMAAKYHPAWPKLKPSVQNIMARNCYQMLGYDLNTPTDFVVCWTKDGGATGGTGQALRIAADLNIEIFNLFDKDAKERLWERVRA